MLKLSCLKDNKEEGVEQIITIKINSITIIDEGIMEYQGKERSYLIFDSLLLQFLPMNILYVELEPISLKELTFIKPLITLEQTQKEGIDFER